MNHTPPRVAVEVDIIPDGDWPSPITLRFRSRAAIREHVAACVALIGALPGDGTGDEQPHHRHDAASPVMGGAEFTRVHLAPRTRDDLESLLRFINGYCPQAVEDALNWKGWLSGPAPEIAAACATAGCGHPRDSHWEHSEPQGTRTGCSLLGCKCQGYAAELAAPLVISDATIAQARYFEEHPLDEELDAAAQDEPLPDCARPGCGHPEAGHRREPSQAIADGLCLHSDCGCAAYALPETEAAR